MSEWSTKDDARLAELAALGWSAAKIASALIPPAYEFRTRSAVVARCRRTGIQLLGKIKDVSERQTLWYTPEVVEMLRALWIEGVSVTRIADRMSEAVGVKITRGAVIGKAHREGLANEFPRASWKDKEACRVRAKMAVREKRIKRERVEQARVFHETPILADVSYARPWQERGPRQCAFPIGERYAVMSCCFPTEETYCAAHRQAMGGTRKPWVNKDFGKSARAA